MCVGVWVCPAVLLSMQNDKAQQDPADQADWGTCATCWIPSTHALPIFGHVALNTSVCRPNPDCKVLTQDRYRYENIRRQQAARLQDNHQRSLQVLKSQERPFSFYGKALAKEEAAKQYKAPTAKDFQRQFKAAPIPKSSLEVNTHLHTSQLGWGLLATKEETTPAWRVTVTTTVMLILVMRLATEVTLMILGLQSRRTHTSTVITLLYNV